MQYLEIILSFIVGLILILFAGMVFSLKTKGLLRLLINTVTGAFLLVALSTLTPLNLPLNPFNALITGALGIFGVLVVFVIVYLL